MSRTTLPVLVSLLTTTVSTAAPLPGTKPLTQEGDLAAAMVAGIGKYLDRETAASVENRKQFWKPDFSSPEAYAKSVAPNRERLKKILGVVDRRVPPRIEYVGGPDEPSLVGEADKYTVHAVRWSVLPGVDGEGLLLEPKGKKPVAHVVALGDADWTPEMLVGMSQGVSAESQFARRLAQNGCRVIVPVLIDRGDEWSSNPSLGRSTNQPHREFIYRMAYQMGRHVIGYEVQKVLAAVEWFTRDGTDKLPVCLVGYGEGGLLALYAGALEPRVEFTSVAGYYMPREGLWKEPIYRNVWGLLKEFGDGEVISLYGTRTIHVDVSVFPMGDHPPARPGRGGAAPGRLRSADVLSVVREFNRGADIVTQIPRKGSTLKLTSGGKLRLRRDIPLQYPGPSACIELLAHVRGVKGLTKGEFDGEDMASPEVPLDRSRSTPSDRRSGFRPELRQKRQFDQLVAFTQKLWRDSDATRRAFWKKANPATPQSWEQTTEQYRTYFHEEVIGKLPPPTLPANPRTRQLYDEPKWTGHEVMLDLYPDVFAYGVLLLPKDLKPGEKRPVVVCQHGLEGRPTDTTNPKERTKYYNSFAAQLADLGYIVYAPQNPYIGKDDFRLLQRKANPLKLSLFSFIIRQHERTLEWLASHPNVDKDKIALYGLSYGGKTAMRVPAVLKQYALSICSGDFNEWIGKNVSIDLPQSYMFTGEWEMFDFDLGNTFNYAEMAYLIAPRPFMVERGHDDGVGTDEMVAYEYAKVRYLYANKLKLPDRTAIEFFPGGHEINGKGTFAFLKQHLGWPK